MPSPFLNVLECAKPRVLALAVLSMIQLSCASNPLNRVYKNTTTASAVKVKGSAQVQHVSVENWKNALDALQKQGAICIGFSQPKGVEAIREADIIRLSRNKGADLALVSRSLSAARPKTSEPTPKVAPMQPSNPPLKVKPRSQNDKGVIYYGKSGGDSRWDYNVMLFRRIPLPFAPYRSPSQPTPVVARAKNLPASPAPPFIPRLNTTEPSPNPPSPIAPPVFPPKASPVFPPEARPAAPSVVPNAPPQMEKQIIETIQTIESQTTKVTGDDITKP